VVDIGIEHAADVLPYRALLRYETLVDGESWSAPGSIVRPYDEGETARIFVACAEPTPYQSFPPLGEGTHVIRRIAWLPGESALLESNEVSVTITCDAIHPEPTGKKSGGCSTAGAPASFWLFFLPAVLWFFRRRRS